ncbi:putative helicase/primase complex protein [Pacmanvirus S19]|nr:putative helicase/primase complex protein [Pacmanvirus S19]
MDRIFLNNNLPRGYRYVKLDSGEDSLERAVNDGFEILDKDSIIIKDRKTFKYYIFSSYQHFANCFSENQQHTCDEIILDWQKQRPKFDIDDYNEDQFDDIYCAIEDYFTDIGTTPDIVICDSSGFSVEKQRWKNSAHLIISNYAFKNSSDAAFVSKEIYNLLSADSKIPFDAGVNKSLQHFRTPLSVKENRQKKVPTGYTREDVMITNCNHLPIINVKQKQNVQNTKKIEVDIDIKDLLNQVSEHIVGWNFRKQCGNLLIFNRTPQAAKNCKFCKREHSHDNTLRLLIMRDGVYLKCIRSAEKELVLKFKRKLEDAIGKEYKFRDFVSDFKFNSHDIYSEPTIKEFNMHRTLYVRANMKMGKTNAAIEYMKNFNCIVVVSFRKTFTNEKLTSFKQLGFRSYEDIKGQINLNMSPKVIIQVESLHRISFDRKPDLILLDESESIFDEFLSSTMKYPKPCIAAFEWLTRNSTNCLAMDANLCDRTIDIIRTIRGVDDEHLIVNNYKNMSNDNNNITESKDDLNKNLLDYIRNDKNIIIPTNSKKYADAIYKLIVKIIDPTKVLKITSATSDEEKAIIFSDVNTEWQKYQVVIFTPTCSAGVSFTEKHFEALFGYFTSSSTVVESWRQSMYRARDISSGEYNICINAPNEHIEYESVDSVKQYIQNINYVNSVEVAALDYTINNEGYREFTENLQYKIFTWGKFLQNKSRCKPIETFVEQCKLSGATMNLIEKTESLQQHKDYSEALKEIKKEEYEAIVASADITSDEFEVLINKSTKTNDEKASIDKFIITSTYKWDKPINMEFMETYADTKTIKAYRGLVEILQSDSPRVSLENIRTTTTDNKIAPANKYIRHKITNDLLNICGYDNIQSNKVIQRTELLNNIITKKDEISKQMGMICFAFGDKRPLTKWELKQILEFMNGIFETMYGIRIAAQSRLKKDRDSFVIKHSLLGSIIDNKTNNDKPFIETNWKYNNQAEQADGFLEI